MLKTKTFKNINIVLIIGLNNLRTYKYLKFFSRAIKFVFSILSHFLNVLTVKQTNPEPACFCSSNLIKDRCTLVTTPIYTNYIYVYSLKSALQSLKDCRLITIIELFTFCNGNVGGFWCRVDGERNTFSIESAPVNRTSSQFECIASPFTYKRCDGVIHLN